MNNPGNHGEHLLRELAPQVLAIVIRRYGNFGAAEDAVQEALLAAAMQWPEQGVPDHPRAWLIQVASRRMSDHLRAEIARRRRETGLFTHAADDTQIAAPVEYVDSGDEDDSLILLFMCCHPALTEASAIALTLRAVGGLSTAEIAHAFLVPEATLAQRISRAKRTIRDSGVPFQTPTALEREQRLAAVLHVLYLVFNEGYASASGPALQRNDLVGEAIRLTRLVLSRLPDHSESAGLLALMLLTDARRPARCGAQGELIPLAEQDRRLWSRSAIAEGIALISRTLPKGNVGPYQLQAAIAAVHDEARRAEETDWPQIAALYTVLLRIDGNPMIALNHAVAVAMTQGAAAGLALLQRLELDTRIAGHYRLAAVRGHLLEMAGERARAAVEFRAAAARTPSVAERNYLSKKAAGNEVIG